MELFKLNNKSEFLNNNLIPKGNIMQISIAQFLPSQSCPIHQHYDLFEVFIVDSGEITIFVDEKKINLIENDLLIVHPKINHSLINETNKLCEILVLGIAC